MSNDDEVDLPLGDTLLSCAYCSHTIRMINPWRAREALEEHVRFLHGDLEETPQPAASPASPKRRSH